MENSFNSKFSEDEQKNMETEIREKMHDIDYTTREYPVEVLVSKYKNGIDTNENEIFIPDYQRDFVWPEKKQSRFIESVLIGLPIPFLFVADVGSTDENYAGRLEVVDGTQRLRTLTAYISDTLVLEELEKLKSLNGTTFSDLLPSRQRRFKRSTIRLIELTEKADEEARRDMFDRLNSGGMNLNPMEIRHGVLKGEFLTFVRRLAASQKLHQLAPLSEASIKRRDYDELVVRFFAYTNNYKNFEKKVIDFVDSYLETKENFDSASDGKDMEEEWNNVLSFVENFFVHGFRKGANQTKTPRVRFEAIAVGVALALKEKPDLKGNKSEIAKWAYGDEFNKLVTADGANSRPKVITRIEFVKNHLLNS